jgi:hypothetical protein
MEAHDSSIALIIPHRDDRKNLNHLLQSIKSWTKMANEIIIVDSSQDSESIQYDFVEFCSSKKIKLIHHQSDKLIYPGHARNIGIDISNSTLIAFLDVKTMPTDDWLDKSFEFMKDESLDGVWGKTIYKCSQNKQKIIRAATYGKLPIKTLPGSLIKRDCFRKAGLFIQSVRAGEDGDWFSRADLHQLNFIDHNKVGLLTYELSKDVTYKNVLLKWYRNNSFASPLPYLKPHKDIYFYLVSIVAVLIAYNWNNLFAAWDLDSILYIPNITKITAGFFFTVYYITRSFLFPFKKGLKVKDLLPIKHSQIFLLSFLLDLVKIAAFFSAAFIKFFQTTKIKSHYFVKK